MPRPKGSKNKKTIAKEAEAARKAQGAAASAAPGAPPTATAPVVDPKEDPGEARCPGCDRKIADIAGEAPTALPVANTWVCASCYDAGCVDEQARPTGKDRWRDVDTVSRRAKILAVCEGAVEHDGREFADILAPVQAVVPSATPQQVRLDLARLLGLGWVEQRGPSEKPRFMLSMQGETRSSAPGSTWHSLASESLVNEEPQKAAEPPTEPPAPAGDPSWVQVARASKEREDAERAAKKPRGKAAPDPQLSIAEQPGAFMMDLPCPVLLEELGQLVDEHVAAADAITDLEEEKAEAMAAFSKRRKTLEGNESALREKVRAARRGKVFRPVECRKVVDGSTVRVIRQDTKEVVEERAASASELEDPVTPDGSTAPAEGVEVRGDGVVDAAPADDEHVHDVSADALEPAPESDSDEEPDDDLVDEDA